MNVVVGPHCSSSFMSPAPGLLNSNTDSKGALFLTEMFQASEMAPFHASLLWNTSSIYSIFIPLSHQGYVGSWSQSQLTPGQGHQSITGHLYFFFFFYTSMYKKHNLPEHFAMTFRVPTMRSLSETLVQHWKEFLSPQWSDTPFYVACHRT